MIGSFTITYTIQVSFFKLGYLGTVDVVLVVIALSSKCTAMFIKMKSSLQEPTWWGWGVVMVVVCVCMLGGQFSSLSLFAFMESTHHLTH